jgi:hypothetical protein
MLAGLDVLVIDLQDVGARIYTYIYTMANCLRAAKRHGIRVVVCDRPNPVGGLEVEGPMLHPGYESFVGLFPIPMRHGMTIGELARLFNEHFAIGAELEVMRMDGWTRDQYFDATGLPWVAFTEHAHARHRHCLSGHCAFEGTMLLKGAGRHARSSCWARRGSMRNGLPRHERTAAARRSVQARRLRTNVPETRQTTCGGCQIHMTDRAAFRPERPRPPCCSSSIGPIPRFAWRQPPHEYEHDKMLIDIRPDRPRLAARRGADTARPDHGGVDQRGARVHTVRESFLLY